MNRLVVSILLLAVMSAGCFWSVFITIDKTNELSGYIDQVEQAHSEGDSEAAVKYANQLHDAWDSVLHYSILVNDLGHAMEITSCIAEISSFAEEGDDELYAACDRAQAQLELFRLFSCIIFMAFLNMQLYYDTIYFVCCQVIQLK